MNGSVLMKINKDFKQKKKNEAVMVIVDAYDNKGDAIFVEVIEDGGWSGYEHYGIKIPERYLDVITRINDPEYFL